MRPTISIPILILSLLMQTAFAEQTKLRISISDYYVGTQAYEQLILFVKSSLAREGIIADISPLPHTRANLLTNSGEFDGEIVSGEINSKEYPNLIHLSFPLLLSRYSLIYRKGEAPTAKNISSLRGVIPLNMQGLEKFLIKGKLNTSGVKTSDSALEMVARKRADYTMASDVVFKSSQQKNYPSLELSTEFYTAVPIHLKLHKKHKNILPKIESAFQNEKQQHPQKYPILKDGFGF